MDKNKEIKISFWASHLTTMVSVTLVLTLVGMIALVWAGATEETQRLKERVEFNVIMTDSVSNQRAAQIADAIKEKPYAQNVTTISREEALKNWTDDTGENLEELYGINPLSPEVRFTLAPEYCTSKNVQVISRNIEKLKEVESVDYPDASLVEDMNRNLSGITGVLGAIAAGMLFVSIVLINNTVRLGIYAHRFSIYTMRLVGATNGYIARPAVMNNLLCGILSGVAADIILGGALYGGTWLGLGNLLTAFRWEWLAGIAGGLVVLGALICALCSWVGMTHYLHKQYDDLFK